MQRLIDDRDVVINTNTQHRHGRGLRHSWRFLLALGLLLAVVLACVSLGGAIQRAIDPVAAERAHWAAYQAQERAARLWWVGDGLSILPLAGGGLLLIAVGRHLLGETTLSRWFDVQETRARHQPGQMPQQLTYSPHIAPQPAYAPPLTSAPALLHTSEPEGSPLALPPVTDLAMLHFRPSVDAILLGLGAGGMPLTVPLRSLWHIGTAGPTGAGKSNIARLVLPQLQALGAKVVIADPKFTVYDAENGEDWRPIARRLHLPAAYKADQIADLLTWATEALEQRLERRHRGERAGAPLFLYLDEFTTITADVPHAAEQVARIARLGRGVGLFLLMAAHNFLVKNGAGDTRDQVRTVFYLGGDLKTGSVLLDLPQRDLSQQEHALTPGVALLRSSVTTPPQLVRVPLASNAAIAGLLGEQTLDTSPAEGQPSTNLQRSEPHPTLKVARRSGEGQESRWECAPARNDDSVRSARIVAQFQAGRSVAEIVKDLEGISSGARYNQVRADVEAVVRNALRRKGGE